jgi:uncharacterized protein (DUF2235 family)
MQQKLALCLDGTWNAQDSGTNIYHLSNLIVEGAVTKGGQTWSQLVYYQEGVGTGMLDQVTGGAFGIGLSRNVREAYDWLIEHYCDGDEIYIFGFSRGAFTARSLVGLISKCGLLRRGAPMPPEELWHAYQILGRLCNSRSGMEPAPSWWERIAGKPKPPFRNIQDLRPLEPWEKGKPVDVKPPANRAEELLVQWSRRVPIHCVGVFDTVGALGLNALAIPWVRDVTAQFHDARLTTLVTHGFQALAIDEHRASFVHVPWYRETGSGIPEGKTHNGGRIEQRWFVGAHSNVGGGYEDGVLSQHALAWMIQETSALGLDYRPIGKGDPNPALPFSCHQCQPLQTTKKGVEDLADQGPTLRDSFSEFAGGIWKHFIRAKREYRHIAPSPELQNGKMAKSLNETVDSSVRDFAKADPTYNPPNLWRYRKDREAEFSGKPPAHRYGEPGLRWWALLAVWLALIALAGGKLGELLDGRLNNGGSVWSWRLALVAPLIAFLVEDGPRSGRDGGRETPGLDGLVSGHSTRSDRGGGGRHRHRRLLYRLGLAPTRPAELEQPVLAAGARRAVDLFPGGHGVGRRSDDGCRPGVDRAPAVGADTRGREGTPRQVGRDLRRGRAIGAHARGPVPVAGYSRLCPQLYVASLRGQLAGALALPSRFRSERKLLRNPFQG